MGTACCAPGKKGLIQSFQYLTVLYILIYWAFLIQLSPSTV